MTNKKLAQAIAKGLIETGVEGCFGAVSCSTAGDYPSIGCSQWESERADTLLSYIDGGDHFIGRAYTDIAASYELGALASLLYSEQGQAAQTILLAQDCLESYVPALLDAGLTNDACIIYAGIWCPTSHIVVSRFVARRKERGYDINNLDVLHQLFRDEYADAADCSEYADGYANRADRTYEYVSQLEVTSNE